MYTFCLADPVYIKRIEKQFRPQQRTSSKFKSVNLKLTIYKKRANVRMVTFRHVCATIVAEEKQWVLHNISVCVCSLRYPACNVHAPYCHLWPAPLCNIFPHLTNGTISANKKSYWTQNVVSTSSSTFVRNISHSKKKWSG